MRATDEALRAEGYSTLTAQAIADRTDRSKSLLFYHYDSLEELVIDYLDFLLEQMDDFLSSLEGDRPIEQLVRFVDWFLYRSADDELASFHAALLELRIQAIHDNRFRAPLRVADDRLHDALERILRAGIDSGDFREHDPERTTFLVLASIDGARVRHLTLGRTVYLEAVRTAIHTDVIEPLVADGVEIPEFHSGNGTVSATNGRSRSGRVAQSRPVDRPNRRDVADRSDNYDSRPRVDRRDPSGSSDREESPDHANRSNRPRREDG